MHPPNDKGESSGNSLLFRAFDHITALSVAERSLLICFVTLLMGVAFWLLFLVAWYDPGYAPYLDREILPRALLLQGVAFVGAWSILTLFAMRARRRSPNSKLLEYATCQLTAMWAFASYFLGHFTFPYLGMMMAYLVLLAVLFDGRAVVFANLTFYSILVATTVLEQQERIPYAPLFSRSPVADDHLASEWIFGVGGLTVLNWVAFMPLLFYAASRAREREATLSRATRVMSRYVPSQLARSMLEGTAETSVQHERRLLTVFFSDIAGFSRIADELEPEEVSGILHEYVAAMAAVAERADATLNQIIGDGLMVLFGAPNATSPKGDAVRAVSMALEMQAEVVTLVERWERRGIQRDLAVRMGLNTGYVTVGDFGSEGRVTYTAIGTPTNVAARIEEICPPGEIWISHSTWLLCREAFECEDRGETSLSGVRVPVRLYRILRRSSAVA